VGFEEEKMLQWFAVEERTVRNEVATYCKTKRKRVNTEHRRMPITASTSVKGGRGGGGEDISPVKGGRGDGGEDISTETRLKLCLLGL
jgi:hypothetical protein